MVLKDTKPVRIKYILVVEDNLQQQDLLSSILAYHGFASLRAVNGRQAVTLASKIRPDLIMMDLSMPIQNGFETTRQIKENPTLAHIPIVAMSAYDSPQTKRNALAAGCVAFLPKPLEIFKLREQLMQILANQRLS